MKEYDTSEAETAVMGKQAIICVDDEPIILLSLKEELRLRMGDKYLYEEAFNANEALELIESLVHDGVEVILILSDWLMPGIKGDDFLLMVKERWPNIKSIMITGHADEVAIEKVLSSKAACAVLHKPWDPEELVRSIKCCFENDCPDDEMI
jgi:DNA-binding NtrC family response regulator